MVTLSLASFESEILECSARYVEAESNKSEISKSAMFIAGCVGAGVCGGV